MSTGQYQARLIPALIVALATSSPAFETSDPALTSIRIDGPGGDERIFASTTDASGNLYVAGSFSSAAIDLSSFADDPDTEGGTSAANGSNILRNAKEDGGSHDLFVAKFDPSGACVWAKSAGGNGDDFATGIAVDADGNVYITGSYTGTASIGVKLTQPSLDRDGNVTDDNGNLSFSTNLFVAMLRPQDGAFQWAKPFEYTLRNTEATYDDFINVNFGPANISVNAHVGDSGAAFPQSTSGPAGEDLNYGWTDWDGVVSQSNDRTEYEDDEVSVFLRLLWGTKERSFIHSGNYPGKAWKIELPAGNYKVTVFNGDVNSNDSFYATQLLSMVGERTKISTHQLTFDDATDEGPPSYDKGTATTVVGDNGWLLLRNSGSADNNKFNYLQIRRQTADAGTVEASGRIALASGPEGFEGNALAMGSDRIFIKGYLTAVSTTNTSPPGRIVLAGPAGDPVEVSGNSPSLVASLKLNNSFDDPTDPANWSWDWLTGASEGTPSTSPLTAVSDLAVDPVLGDLLVTGRWADELTLGGTAESTGEDSPVYGFLARINPANGRRLTLSTITSSVGTPSPRSLVVDASGHPVVAGQLMGNHSPSAQLSFSPSTGANPLTLSNGGNADIFVAKANPAGEWIWTENPGGLGSRTANHIGLISTGQLYLTGRESPGSIPLNQTYRYLRITPTKVRNDDAITVTSPGGWTVRRAWWAPSGTVSDLDNALDLLAPTTNPEKLEEETVTGIPQINFGPAEAGDLRGDDDRWQAERHFAIMATATITVAAGSEFVFVNNGNQRGELRVGATVVEIPSRGGKTVLTLAAGDHAIRWITFASTTALEAELYYAQAPRNEIRALAVRHASLNAIRMFDPSGEAIDPETMVASTPGGTPEEDASAAFTLDDDVRTNWVVTGVNKAIVLDLGSPTALGGYRLVTNTEHTGWDPVRFLVEGSHDNSTWTVADDRSLGDLTYREQRRGEITFSGSLPFVTRLDEKDGTRNWSPAKRPPAPTGLTGSFHGVAVHPTRRGSLWWLTGTGIAPQVASPEGDSTLGNRALPHLSTDPATNLDTVNAHGALIYGLGLDLQRTPPSGNGDLVVGDAVEIPDELRPDQDLPIFKLIVDGTEIAGGDLAQYLFWDAPSRRFLVTSAFDNGALLTWTDSSNVTGPPDGTFTVSSRWPTSSDEAATFQRHVVDPQFSVTVDLAPAVVPPPGKQFSFGQILFSSAGATATNNRFTATNEGWSSLLYVAPDPQSGANESKIVTVQTIRFDDPELLDPEPTPVVVGEALDPLAFGHANTSDGSFDPDGPQGFVVHPASRYDGTGDDAAHDRDSRLGPIIPVNLNGRSPDEKLAVVWFSPDAFGLGTLWPTTPVAYGPQWPSAPELIIVSSFQGSELTVSGVEDDGTGNPVPPLAARNFGGGAEAEDSVTYTSIATPRGATALANPEPGLSPIYQTAFTGAAFEVEIPTGNGDFIVTLHFAEPLPGPASPVYRTDLTAEGSKLLEDFDILSAAGDHNTAITESVTATVTDGVLSLAFEASTGADGALVSAVSVTPATLYSQERLDPVRFLTPRIYHQPDRDLAGYNPNEEHALVAPSPKSSFDAVFALRTDLNHHPGFGGKTSDPYALLKYRDATDEGRWKFKVYRVALEGEVSAGTTTRAFSFSNLTGVAGSRVEPPYPLSLFPPQDETRNDSPIDGDRADAYWKDHKNDVWARSAGQVVVEYFYPQQPGFPYPRELEGGAIPWLEYATAGEISDGRLLPEAAGQPLKTVFEISWPAYAPELFVGETLRKATRGLPEIANWAAGQIIFDENERLVQTNFGFTIERSSNLTARLIDSMSERAVPFPAKVDGTTLVLQPAGNPALDLDVSLVSGGRYEFTGLPPHLRRRVLFDPSSQALIFRGIYDESQPAAPLAMLNVLSRSEEAELAAASASTTWANKVAELAALTRNPNAVDTSRLAPDPLPTLVGLQPSSPDRPHLVVPEIVRAGLALTAGLATERRDPDIPDERLGYITLAENNDPALGAAPVSLHIIKVVPEQLTGSIRLVNSSNPLDEQVTLRHSGDFGGDPDSLFFEWYLKDDSDGKPTTLPPDGAGWNKVAEGPGVNQVTLAGSGKRTLVDNWAYVRFRKATDGELAAAELSPVDTAYSDTFPTFPDGTDRLAGDPSFVSSNSPMFVPGWVKRVLEGINPFEQRIRDFHQAPTATYVSMIQQAGAPFEGPVALNAEAGNLDNVGLIALYQTVLQRALALSINGTSPESTAAVDNALLLAASRVSDLYMLLGNEAFADALDPTLGISVGTDGDFTTVNASAFAFQNQLPSLLSEELVLLRGRDDSSAGVQASPVFNRLFWNFTSGLEGEPAYALNYNIADINGVDETGRPTQLPDGFITELDAATRFPQGHGDAWGHYLSALKTYYRLLRHPQFDWEPRAETTIVAGVPLKVDYLDEVKFARAAAARAQAAESIVDLTYRGHYTADPAGQWQGYKDTDEDRAWGVDGWARRAGQGAVLDWMVANAILPEDDVLDQTEALSEDDDPGALTRFNESSVDKIDRRTVGELRQIAASLTRIQTQLDKADQGLNPLGLHNDAIPFDIDPSINTVEDSSQRETHFEQIYSRARKAVSNAVRTFDHANGLTERLRQVQLDADEFQRDAEEQEFAMRNRMLEIFGYPYSGDIGPGKTYPTGYDGPDLYKWMYVDVAEVTAEPANLAIQRGGGNNVAEGSSTFTAFFQSVLQEPASTGGEEIDLNNDGENDTFADAVSFYFPDDLPDDTSEAASSFQAAPEAVQYALSIRRWAFEATEEMGERRAPGTIQFALNEMLQTESELLDAIGNYGGLISAITNEIDLLEARYGIFANELVIREDNLTDSNFQNELKAASEGIKDLADNTADTVDALSDTAKESLPQIVGLSNDTTGIARLTIKSAADIIVRTSKLTSSVASAVANGAEVAKDKIALSTEIELVKNEFQFEVQERLKSIEQLMGDEVNARLEIFALEQAHRAAIGEFQAALAEGQRLIEERKMHRRRLAGPVQQLRYQDIAFRNYRNEALGRYKAAFDLASRYVYLAAKTYDYETNLLDSSSQAGQQFLTSIVKQRSLGQFLGGEPVHGVDGLSDPMAQLGQNFDVLKGQLGFNNPQQETGRFSLRHELFRMRDSSEDAWKQVLADHVVDDLWQIPEFRRYCRPFAPESAGPQPGIVFDFPTTVTFGLNYFGWPLAGGDSSYDSSNFATKVNGAGVWFENYNGKGLAATPRVYLIPVGLDVMRSPSFDSLATREFNVVDQVLPVPFPIGNDDLSDPGYIPINSSLDNSFARIRRFGRFLAHHDDGNPLASFPTDELARNTRLIGRSVWNTRWMLIIPGGTFLNDAADGIETFIHGQTVPGGTERDGNGVKDIKIFFETYSYSGN